MSNDKASLGDGGNANLQQHDEDYSFMSDYMVQQQQLQNDENADHHHYSLQQQQQQQDQKQQQCLDSVIETINDLNYQPEKYQAMMQDISTAINCYPSSSGGVGILDQSNYRNFENIDSGQRAGCFDGGSTHDMVNRMQQYERVTDSTTSSIDEKIINNAETNLGSNNIYSAPTAVEDVSTMMVPSDQIFYNNYGTPPPPPTPTPTPEQQFADEMFVCAQEIINSNNLVTNTIDDDSNHELNDPPAKGRIYVLQNLMKPIAAEAAVENNAPDSAQISYEIRIIKQEKEKKPRQSSGGRPKGRRKIGLFTHKINFC